MNTIKCMLIVTPLIISMGSLSCSPVVYSTTGQNVPLFQEKGEAVFNIGYSHSTDGNDYAEGVNGQLALAIDSNLALMGSIYAMSQESGDWTGKGSYFDLGIGMFKTNSSKRFKGEIFIGVGFGSIKNKTSDNFHFDSKFLKPFIQPSGGFSIKNFEVAVTPRIALVDFKSSSTNDIKPHLKKTTLVFEPGATLRAGFKYVRFQYQINVSTFSLSDSDFTAYTFYSSLGISFLISNRWE